ncbi:hypothetical protein ACHAW6_012045 [Cyclotella cf. meneghiniana]
MNRRKISNSVLKQRYYKGNEGVRHQSKPFYWGVRSSLPYVSVSSLVVLFACLSTLSALLVGINRSQSYYKELVDNKVDVRRNKASDIRRETYKLKNNSEINDSRTIHSLKDLTPSQLHPQATSNRHIVTPPIDKIPISLVSCHTTKGFLHIVVHPSWAPLGANRFLRMVNTGYFSSKVALMRCLRNFICQFGIAGDPTYNIEYNGSGKNLKDDPNWLPEGPSHRTNELEVKRFAKGYLAYAGGGKDSRSNQFIVALNDNERLGGGSPWEVPWGEVVGEESFATLDKIYTGYGEKGPSQGRLSREGSSEEIAKEFPMLDYILSCDVVDSD